MTSAKRASWTQKGLLILLPSAIPGNRSEDDRLWKEFESSKLRSKYNSTIAGAASNSTLRRGCCLHGHGGRSHLCQQVGAVPQQSPVPVSARRDGSSAAPQTQPAATSHLQAGPPAATQQLDMSQSTVSCNVGIAHTTQDTVNLLMCSRDVWPCISVGQV